MLGIESLYLRGATMQNASFEVIHLSVESGTANKYDNHPIARGNDHEVRISTMTEAYHWHCHPDSDESFLALEGGLFIDFDDRTVELRPGQDHRQPRRPSSHQAHRCTLGESGI